MDLGAPNSCSHNGVISEMDQALHSTARWEEERQLTEFKDDSLPFSVPSSVLAP